MAALADTVRFWGSTEEERATALHADALVPGGVPVLRAVDVEAPAAVTFRWVCQLKVAPYSYDLLDNRGRRSPQQLTPGLDELRAGERWMTIFRLRSFTAGEAVTLEYRGPLFGHIGVTYRVTPRGPDASRLVMRMSWEPRAPGPLRPLAIAAFGAGDLVMARRQLLNLKQLAEAQQRAPA
jgi:hypothetical protein